MKHFHWLKLVWCGLATLIGSISTAQNAYPAINESKLLNTKWKYTYTTHAESNTVIHKADQNYKYFLYLKFDYTLEHSLNGRIYKDYWELNPAKNELYYNYRQIKWWRIAEFSEKSLILEFSVTDKASYRYHFVPLPEKESPFVRNANELPLVNVETMGKGDKKAYTPQIHKKQNRKRIRYVKENKKVVAAPAVPMKIELLGGGYFGGNDPIYYSFIVIESDGRLVKEVKTERRGTVKTKRDIGRAKLEEFMKYVESKQYFSLESHYGCKTTVCDRRFRQDPKPIPLRIAITHGSKRKVISIDIFGTDERNVKYVDYPADIDLIVDAIQKMAD
jgi:hypothetical protein